MISQTAEYALRAVVFLAENAGTGYTVEQISQSTQIPSAYLSKVLQQLARAGLVKSRRGLGGGFILNGESDEFSVLEVINAVDPIERIFECPLGLEAHATKLCPLHSRLDEATASVERAFGDTTIANLLADPRRRKVYTFPCDSNKKRKP